MLGILLLFGTILGRTICGWLCPFGLIQELLHRLPAFKIKKNRMTRLFSWLKYVILVIFCCSHSALVRAETRYSLSGVL